LLVSEFAEFCLSSNPITPETATQNHFPPLPIINFSPKERVQKVVTLSCNPMPKFGHIQVHFGIIVKEE